MRSLGPVNRRSTRRHVRCVMDSPGYALERPNIVGLDPALATITFDEAFLARPLACWQARGAVTFVGFQSLEILRCCVGKHECHLSLGFACVATGGARPVSRHQDLVLPDHTHV